MRSTIKPRVIWDLDDTLNDLMRAWLPWHAKTFGAKLRLNYPELVENPPHKLLHLKKSDYLASLDKFRCSEQAQAMQPARKILDWFGHYGFAFEHHVITARPLSTVPAAAEWVFTHFGRWIRHFHFSPASRPSDGLPDADKGKHRIIQQLGGADFMIDDLETNLRAARPYVKQGLFAPQPWNRNRYNSWDSVLATITANVPKKR